MRRLLILSCLALGIGCAGAGRSSDYTYTFRDETTMRQETLRQGAMPATFTWTGVFQSPEIGNVEFVQTGEAVVGRYEYDRGSCHVVARMEGRVTGNLARVRWSEDHRVCGRLAPIIGHAYFLFWSDDDGRRGRIDGEWGYGENERGGGHWGAFHLRNRQPTMLSESSGSSGSSGSSDTSGSSGGSSEGSGGGGSSGGSGGGGL